MQLFIDTSSDYIQLALKHEDTSCPIFTSQLLAGKKMSEGILPLLDSLLKKASIKIDAIKEIFCCRGPGSFTGVRIGISLAQGLALGLGIKCYGISTLDIMAAFHHFVKNEDGFKVASLINGNIFAVRSYLFSKNEFSKYYLEERIDESYLIASYPLLPRLLDILPFNLPHAFVEDCSPLYLMKPQAELDAQCR